MSRLSLVLAISGLLAISCLGVALAAAGATPTPFPERELTAGSDFAFDAATGAVRRWYGADAGPFPGDAEAAALAFLAGEAASLGLAADLADLETAGVRRGIGTAHIRFRQMIGGVPVFASDIVVSLTEAGRVTAVSSDYWLGLELGPAGATPATPAVDLAQAIEVAARDRGAPGPYPIPPCGQLVVYPFTSPARLAWRVVLKPAGTDALWEVFVDAASAAVLSARDLTWRADGSGLVFDPDPVTTAHAAYGDPGFLDGDDATTPELDAERRQRTLRDLVVDSGLYYLVGPHVRISDVEAPADPAYFEATPDGFAYDRSEQAFEAVMAYYHIDTLQRWIQSLGFDDVNASQQRVDPHGLNEVRNAHYCPEPGPDCVGFDYISLGEGDVDAGEDADVILHEYGHAIQDDQVPGWGIYYETRAMGEGFGDYIAGSYSAAIDGWNEDWWAQWWERVAGGDPGERPLDSTKHYPEDLVWEVHDDGEMWSRCLWDIHAQLGRTIADRLVLQSHFYLLPGASFRDGAEAILEADRVMYANAHAAAIRVIFEARGFLRTQPFEVSLASPQGSPSAAFESLDGFGRDYLVVWEDERDPDPVADIYGARVTASGALLQTDIPLKATAEYESSPDVAFVAKRDLGAGVIWSGFLTAYEFTTVMGDTASDVWYFWTNWQGTPAVSWPITNLPFQTGFRPAVATVADTFGISLVVWNGFKPGIGWGIYGARVSAATGLLDPGGFPVSAADFTFSAAFADVAYDGNKFLVVWEGAGDNIEGSIVHRDGTVAGPFAIAVTADPELTPAVAFDGVDFLVVWARVTGLYSDLYAARVDTTGVVLDPGGGFQVTQTPESDWWPAIQMGSSRALVTWTYLPNQGGSMRGATILPDGTVRDPGGFEIAPINMGGVESALAFDGMTHLVTWNDGPQLHVRAAIVRADSFPEVPLPGTAGVGSEPPAFPAPPALALRAPHPNPTRAGTAVRVAMPAAGRASLEVYDVAGRLVRVLGDGLLAAGEHTVVWDGLDAARRRAAAGVYFIRCETDFGAEARKVVVAR